MGEVYKATDTRLDRTVAIKVLPEHVASDPDLKQRFEREARTVAALNHPHICTLHDIGSQDGIDFLVMEYLDGETVAQRLEKGALPLDQALQIAIDIADALDKAHRQGIVHRDLKPANIMLTEQAFVKVMDFGLAKRTREVGASASQEETRDTLTGTATLIGTPAYMAPEQILGAAADVRSDIFAFGVVLYEMLVGCHPFRKEVTSDTLGAIIRDAPTPPPDQSALADYPLFEKLLAKRPHERYQTFTEVSREVRRLRDETSAGPVHKLARQTPLGTRRTPYVGREKEHRDLSTCVDQAIRGHGGIVFVGGEPGVGKTRLVEQVQAEAEHRNCLTLTGRAYETDGSPPFIPFVEIVEQCIQHMPPEALRTALGDAAPEVARLVPDLRRQFSDIPPPLELPPDQQRRYLFKNVAEFFERASRLRCIVALLDDLQWADAATLDLLQHLAPLLAKWPVLLLGTYRDVELDVGRPFAQTLESLKRKRLAIRLNLRRLGVDDVGAMLNALGGPNPPTTLVTAVYEETEGNPFFVEEVFQHLNEEGAILGDDGTWRTELELQDVEVPEGVRLVIGRRLERISQESQRVLTIGAIVGRGFGLQLLEAIGDVTDDTLLTALEESEQAYLIVPIAGREPRWEFSHALIRQTLSASLSLPRRQRLHLRVADALERMSGAEPETRAADLAHHLYQAGTAADVDRTVHFLEVAGRQAFDAGSFEEALRLVDRATGLLAADSGPQRARFLLTRGRILHSLHRTEESVADYERAFELYDTLGDLDGVTNASMEVALQFSYRGEPRRAIPTVRRGLALTGDEPSAGRARLLSHGALAFAIAGDYEAAQPWMDEAVVLARSLEDRVALADVLSTLAFYNWMFLQCQECVDSGREAVALGQSLGQPWMWLPADAYRRVGLSLLGDWRAATDGLDEVAELAERLGQIQAINCHHDVRVLHQLMTGDIRGYARAAEAKRRFCVEVDYPWKFVAQTFLGLAAFWRGEWDQALEHLKQSYEHGREQRTQVSTWGNYAMALAYRGDPEVATVVEEGRSGLPTPGTGNTVGAWGTLLRRIEVLAVLGRREEAAELYPLAVEAIDTGATIDFFSMVLFQLPAAIAAAAGNRWEAAEEHFRTAIDQVNSLPYRLAQPEVRRWYAWMLLDRAQPGDQKQAQALLGEATKMYRSLGMPRHLEIVDSMLASREPWVVRPTGSRS